MKNDSDYSRAKIIPESVKSSQALTLLSLILDLLNLEQPLFTFTQRKTINI